MISYRDAGTTTRGTTSTYCFKLPILNRLLTLDMWELNKNSQNFARIGVQKHLHGTQILMKVNTQGTTYAKKILFHKAYKTSRQCTETAHINYQIK